ncbi:MAG: hypothetical protein ACON4G_06395 [Candidatus Puniceispirillaceae bacterium]
MFHQALRSLPAVISSLFLLTACFSAETTITFQSDENVKIKTALILERELVALADADPESGGFCQDEGEIREDVAKGISCAMEESMPLSTALQGSQTLAFGGQTEQAGAEGQDLSYSLTKQNDGSYLIRFDLQALKDAVNEQALGDEVASAEELEQVKALVMALFADSAFALRVVAPNIISTNGTMPDGNTAEFSFALTDIFDEFVVPDSFDVTFRL